MSENQEHDQDVARVKKALADLGEHFDTVQIFCTRHEIDSDSNGGTVNIQLGTGDWFARYGLIRHWIVRAEEDAAEQARRNYEES